MHVVNYDAGLNKSSGFVYSNLAFRYFNYFSNPAPERFDICTFGSLDQQACLKDIKTEVKEEIPKKGQQHVKTEIKEESLKGKDERVKDEIAQKAEVPEYPPKLKFASVPLIVSPPVLLDWSSSAPGSSTLEATRLNRFAFRDEQWGPL